MLPINANSIASIFVGVAAVPLLGTSGVATNPREPVLDDPLVACLGTELKAEGGCSGTLDLGPGEEFIVWIYDRVPVDPLVRGIGGFALLGCSECVAIGTTIRSTAIRSQRPLDGISGLSDAPGRTAAMYDDGWGASAYHRFRNGPQLAHISVEPRGEIPYGSVLTIETILELEMLQKVERHVVGSMYFKDEGLQALLAFKRPDQTIGVEYRGTPMVDPTIALIDITGREIDRNDLAREQGESQDAVLMGTLGAGMRLPSGVYFVVLRDGGTTLEGRKVVLVK